MNTTQMVEVNFDPLKFSIEAIDSCLWFRLSISSIQTSQILADGYKKCICKDIQSYKMNVREFSDHKLSDGALTNISGHENDQNILDSCCFYILHISGKVSILCKLIYWKFVYSCQLLNT